MERIKDKEYRTITGKRTTNVCGMCFARCHTGALTVQQLKEHKCLKRKCDAFRPFEDHQYWEQRKNKKLRAQGVV